MDKLKSQLSQWFALGVVFFCLPASRVSAQVRAGHIPSDRNAAPAALSGVDHWWPGDGDAIDRCGSADGTLLNGVGFSGGFGNRVFEFDGVDDLVDFGTTAGNFGVNDFTIQFSLRTTSKRPESLLTKRNFCLHQNFWSVGLKSDGSVEFELEQDTSGVSYFSLGMTNTVNDGGWHEIAIVRQGVRLAMYLDGILGAVASSPSTISLSNTSKLLAGAGPCDDFGGTFRFTGALDEIKLYHLALDPTAPAMPQLAIQELGDAITVSWNSTPEVFLEETTSLISPLAWVTVTDVSVGADNRSRYTIANGSGTGFFRLRHQ